MGNGRQDAGRTEVQGALWILKAAEVLGVCVCVSGLDSFDLLTCH